MKSRVLFYVLAFAAILALSAPTVAYAHKVHKVAIHVDDSDPKRQNMALNNAFNVNAFYESKGEKVIIEVVAYGPGLMMPREDKSKVRDRITKMSLELPNLSFVLNLFSITRSSSVWLVTYKLKSLTANRPLRDKLLPGNLLFASPVKNTRPFS